MFLLTILLIVGLVAYLGFKYFKRRFLGFVDKCKNIEIPPGYRLVSVGEDIYIIEDRQGRQEIVYFKENNNS